MSDSVEKLKAFITMVCREKMNIDVSGEVDHTAMIGEAFDLDSISTYELILNIEEKYQIKVQDDDIEKISKMSLLELDGYLAGAAAAGRVDA